MKNYQKKIITIVVLVLVGILSVTIVTLAASDIPWEWSSEPGSLPSGTEKSDSAADSPDEGGALSAAHAAANADLPSGEGGGKINEDHSLNPTGFQPDDDGYTGLLPETTNFDAPPSSDSATSPVPDWSIFFTEPQPDDNIAREGITGAETDLLVYSYFHAAGSAFRPRDSSVDWANDGSGGCLYHTAGNVNEIYNIHLEIPNGAFVNYLRIYYYDTSASDSYAWITRYDDDGGFVDIINVSSVGNTGYGTMLSAYFEHTVDSVNYSYVLNWRPYVTGSTMQLCGLRVAYELP